MSRKALNDSFIVEYKNFLEEYLFPLLGLVDKKLVCDKLALESGTNVGNIVQEDCTVYFFASGWRLFKLELDESEKLPDENVRLADRVITSFFALSENKRTGSGKQNKILNPLHRADVYNTIIEKGICGWIVNHNQNVQIERLFSILEKWSVKTYEGRNEHLAS